MNRACNKGDGPKSVKKVSNFEDLSENFFSDKTVHIYNMGFYATYSTIITLQCNRALFLISVVIWEKNEIL
jgi:hypothetical protein